MCCFFVFAVKICKIYSMPVRM